MRSGKAYTIAQLVRLGGVYGRAEVVEVLTHLRRGGHVGERVDRSGNVGYVAEGK